MGGPVTCECCGAAPATELVSGGVRTDRGWDEGELSLTGATLDALMARPGGGAELFDLHDRAEIIAWLDARGLGYSIPPGETPQEKLARLLGSS